LDIEETADKAAAETGELVEPDYFRSTNHKSGAQRTADRAVVFYQDDLEHASAESSLTWTEPAPQDSSDIPAWVLTESEEMSREVTPPTQLFFKDQGERQHGDCGPAAVIKTLSTQHWSLS
jgi:hypothetical protein